MTNKLFYRGHEGEEYSELALVRVQMWRLGMASALEDSDDGDDDVLVLIVTTPSPSSPMPSMPSSGTACPVESRSFSVLHNLLANLGEQMDSLGA